MSVRSSGFAIGLGVAMLVATGCGGDGAKKPESAEPKPAAPEAKKVAAEGDKPPHWTYEGAEGPEKWGSLSDKYAKCADGSAQSPINVEKPEPGSVPDLRFDYKAVTAEVTDNGHTVQANIPAGSSIVLDGVTYPLLQVHYHDPSEHTIAGRSFPVEFHFVHKAADGTLAVVGEMVTPGKAHASWQPFFDVLPVVAADGHGKPTTKPLDLTKLLPVEPGKHVTRYDGSLTTPPCSEGVHWLLLEKDIQMSQSQIATLTGRYHDTNRPVEPVNGRRVVLDTSEGD